MACGCLGCCKTRCGTHSNYHPCGNTLRERGEASNFGICSSCWCHTCRVCPCKCQTPIVPKAEARQIPPPPQGHSFKGYLQPPPPPPVVALHKSPPQEPYDWSPPAPAAASGGYQAHRNNEFLPSASSSHPTAAQTAVDRLTSQCLGGSSSSAGQSQPATLECLAMLIVEIMRRISVLEAESAAWKASLEAGNNDAEENDDDAEECS